MTKRQNKIKCAIHNTENNLELNMLLKDIFLDQLEYHKLNPKIDLFRYEITMYCEDVTLESGIKIWMGLRK